MKKILWIEDEKEQFNMFSCAINKEYRIIHSDNYLDALTLIKEFKFDIYITDIIIPSGKKNITIEELFEIKEVYLGIELIKHIRSHDTDAPIIVLSVITSSSVIDEIYAIDSMVNILWKYEVDINDIKIKIDSLLSS